MSLLADVRALSHPQRAAIWASYLGWTLDAFDFFLLVFLKPAIGRAFGVDDAAVSELLFATLAARPFGAFAFGWAAERFGRRPVLMIVILLFSGFSVLSGFAWSFASLLVIRALFGFAMGGEWGVGASLAMETIPPRLRGLVSGILQSGYPSGYFLASIAFALFFDRAGWRGMFFIGVAPALLVFLIRTRVEESPIRAALADAPRIRPLREIAANWRIALYLVAMMTAFNFLSHGTQDQYPTFLQHQHGFDAHLTGLLTGVMNAGAIVGGLSFGIWSERIGRRRAIVLASLMVLPVIPLWAFGAGPVALAAGAFLIQVAVQGAWGVVPVHLNELSPPRLRGLFPGVAYQLGNLLASRNGPFQAGFAQAHGGDYGLALALVAGVTALALAGWTWFGPERRDVDFAAEATLAAAPPPR
ncbi:MFS transporter [Sphingomonas bacterium]|uniref:MFS transporter n=1 Tax=Sphingomonas bacterium TaxID=1895847 RepID=UPI0015766D1A|nr:MFS transporter [Sphingomonas bacterium]